MAYVSPPSIIGLASNFWTSLYFSFSTLVTANYGDIVPTSSIARLLVSFEVASGLLIGIILFFIFTTIILDKYKKDISVLIEKLLDEEVVIKDLMKREFNKGIRDLLVELSYLNGDGSVDPKKKPLKFLLPDEDENLDGTN